MTAIRVDIGIGDAYDVLIEDGLVERARTALAPWLNRERILIVSDEQVWVAQGERLLAGLEGLAAEPILVPAGEASKSWASLERVCERLLELGIERHEPIIAFGGGVVGDLAGFAAAIVKRGGPFVQIPTSLLAQVDSSVGGKTGINSRSGKNMIGAFHQPVAVLIDPACLETLPQRELGAGYAEIAKYALVRDAALFDWLETTGPSVLTSGRDRLRAIKAAIAGKAAIVAEDALETKDIRALLNLGHTFGHALEAETGFGEGLLHGEAVALGTMLAFDFSAANGLCDAADAERVRAHFATMGLPVRLGAADLAGKGNALAAHMSKDKKVSAGKLRLVLVRGIGQGYVEDRFTLGDVAAFLDQAA